MKNLTKAAIAAIVVMFFFATTGFGQLPGVLSPDGTEVEVNIKRSPQRTVVRTVTINQTDSLTAEAVDRLTRQVVELNKDVTQRRIADSLELAGENRWKFWEALGLIFLSLLGLLLGLWFVLSNLDPQRFQVTVNQPNPPATIPPAPTSTNDEIRAIVLETLGEGDYFRSSAYAESRGIAVKAGGNVTIITGGSKKERRRAILLGTATPAPDAAPQGGNQTTAQAVADVLQGDKQ